MSEDLQQSPHLMEGKVAGVLNERELLINIGESQGVQTGMRFKVLADRPVEVSDPDTGETLGTLDREKVRVKAVEVHDRFSICRTYRTRTVGSAAFWSIAEMIRVPKEVPETLRAEDSAYPPPLSEEESYIKRGDRVVELRDVE